MVIHITIKPQDPLIYERQKKEVKLKEASCLILVIKQFRIPSVELATEYKRHSRVD